MDTTSANLPESPRSLDDARSTAPVAPRTESSDDGPGASPDVTIDIDTLDADVDPMDHENNSRIYTPPPRIAARFYRPSAARRKGSAASSRRNSISSAHSRSSRGGDGRHHGGPQSKHVAWHLRRANFLEDRKARLADRAAYAEKVRLRAALAKAAPRGAAANCIERVEAARQARQRNLDEIVATCAADVRRAKAVAENIKEKREQETARLRVQMEERMAEADRRREELRKINAARRGRSQSAVSRKNVEVMPQVMEQDSDPEPEPKQPIEGDVAAGRIQHWWRACQRKEALRKFAELGLSIDVVGETSFEKVVDLLGKEEVLISTARCLHLCGLKEGEMGSVNEMAAVRTFLSAFLILGHPTQVLSSKQDQGEQEQVCSTMPVFCTTRNCLSSAAGSCDKDEGFARNL